MNLKKPSRKTASANRRCLRRFVRLRDCATISNDLAEGFPVTKAELLKLVREEQRYNQRQQNRINALRDAMVKIGLMITTVEQYSPRHHEIFKVISDALKQPNEKS
jgi:hypothetical protein